MKELSRNSTHYRDTIRVGIATMPGRESTLARVLNRIAPQVDEVFVYLNQMASVPRQCRTVPNNVKFYTGPDLGDRGKFAFLDGFTGYYITVDDDIAYAKYHVSNLLSGIERYERKAIVGWHGSIILEPFNDYYSQNSRKTFTYFRAVEEDIPVHVLGTGASGFHTDTLRLDFADFRVPNMADVFVALAARKQIVPMIVLAHRAREASPLKTTESISEASLRKHPSARQSLNVADTVTKIVKENSPWPRLEKIEAKRGQATRINIYDAIDERLGTGGRLSKEASTTEELLRAHGCLIESRHLLSTEPHRFVDPDLALVFASDLNLQRVHSVVEHYARSGTPVLVQSAAAHEPGHETLDQLSIWNERFSGLVRMGVFSDSWISKLDYSALGHTPIELPGFEPFPPRPLAQFDTSKGVYVGDAAQLTDPKLVGDDFPDFLRAVRSAIPEAKIYASQDPDSKVEAPPGIDEIWCLEQTKLVPRLLTVRLAILLSTSISYPESIIDATRHGVPVLQRITEASENQHSNLVSVGFRDAMDLSNLSRNLYRNPVVWRQISKANCQWSRSQDFSSTSARTFITLLNFIQRTKLKRTSV
ncbi:hypothetical protein [Yaniella halotolerans]|uniref:hypothetical protein n=1 Tax=Yaniella halotolerans TaxID=225453 RepID=UPI0003B5AEE6|nr:hypothetical protein [Yaniella halotolerans]